MQAIFRMRPAAMLLTMALALAALPAQAETWKIDPDHSAAHFSIRHLMIAQVRGMFPAVSGSVDMQGDRPVAFDVSIEVDSLDTGVDKRDQHLKSADFFEAAAYPVMTFKSSEIVPHPSGYVVSGTLTIKGVSRQETLLFTGLGESRSDPSGNIRRGGRAEVQLDRALYNVDWNAPLDGGGVMIGNEVDIVVDVEVLKP